MRRLAIAGVILVALLYARPLRSYLATKHDLAGRTADVRALKAQKRALQRQAPPGATPQGPQPRGGHDAGARARGAASRPGAPRRTALHRQGDLALGTHAYDPPRGMKVCG